MAKIENVSKWGRNTARERYASGGSAFKESKTDKSVPTTTRFLPEYDFDYDPTGGHTTSELVFQQDQPELTTVKSRMDKPLRGESDVGNRVDRPYGSQFAPRGKRGGRIK